MTISTIIPVYNRAELVRRTLQSVVSQTRLPDELVLVDNCSTDSTLQALKDFRQANNGAKMRVKVVQEPVHTASAARNRGFAEASSEWVMFFDSDDEMQPTLIQSYTDAAEANPMADVIAVRAELHTANGGKRQLTFATHDVVANHILHSILATQRYAVRHDFFAKAGLWNASLLGWDDWEMGLRLLLHQPKLAFVNQVLVRTNDSGNASITGTEFHSRTGEWENVIDVMQSELEESDIKGRNRYLRLLDYRRIVLAAHYSAEGHPELAKPLYIAAAQRLTAQRPLLAAAIPWLYHRIRRGKRGSARIARILI